MATSQFPFKVSRARTTLLNTPCPVYPYTLYRRSNSSLMRTPVGDTRLTVEDSRQQTGGDTLTVVSFCVVPVVSECWVVLVIFEHACRGVLGAQEKEEEEEEEKEE